MSRRKPKVQPAPVEIPKVQPAPVEIPKTVWVEIDERHLVAMTSDTPFRYSPEEFRNGLSREGREGIMFLHQAGRYERILIHKDDGWVPALTVDPPMTIRIELDLTLRNDTRKALEELEAVLRSRYLENILDFHIGKHQELP